MWAHRSWARIAKSQDVPMAALSEAMGAHSARTTHLSPKSFDNILCWLRQSKGTQHDSIKAGQEKTIMLYKSFISYQEMYLIGNKKV